MSVFSEQVQNMASVINQVFGDTITYTPAGGSPITLVASIGPTEVMLDDGTLGVLSFEDRDFCVVTTDLSVSGAIYEPKRGDVINDGTNSYAVTIPSGLKECWTWADRFKIRRRIHVTKTT